MGFWGISLGCVAAQAYPTKMKLGVVIPYAKEIQKKFESRNTAPEFC